MSEIGIDISSQYSKHIGIFSGMQFDYVVTVCDRVKETCPNFKGGKKYLHNNFKDTSEFQGTYNEKVHIFREVRNQIENWIIVTFKNE